jgi:hypothetical protein
MTDDDIRFVTECLCRDKTYLMEHLVANKKTVTRFLEMMNPTESYSINISNRVIVEHFDEIANTFKTYNEI